MVQLHCEYEEAFEEDHDYITRGLAFSEEASRLWLPEMGRASLTNLQALTVMCMEWVISHDIEYRTWQF